MSPDMEFVAVGSLAEAAGVQAAPSDMLLEGFPRETGAGVLCLHVDVHQRPAVNRFSAWPDTSRGKTQKTGGMEFTPATSTMAFPFPSLNPLLPAHSHCRQIPAVFQAHIFQHGLHHTSCVPPG